MNPYPVTDRAPGAMVLGRASTDADPAEGSTVRAFVARCAE